MKIIKRSSLAVLLSVFALSWTVLSTTAQAESNPFESKGVITSADQEMEGKCGEAKMKKDKGKCGEGKCGEAKMKKKAKGKCGEGKCGEAKMKKNAKGKCGEGKCGEAKMKKNAKGKCGENKAKTKKCGG